jgi:hypothetical protein
VTCERVLPRNALIATAGARVISEVGTAPSTATHHPRCSKSIRLSSLLDGTRAVPIIFIASTHEQAARQDVRVDDQIHGQVVVLETGDGGVFGLSGSTG